MTVGRLRDRVIIVLTSVHGHIFRDVSAREVNNQRPAEPSTRSIFTIGAAATRLGR